MIVTIRGAGCDGRLGRAVMLHRTTRQQADGKAVWSRRRDRGVHPGLPVRARQRWQANAVHRGERGISRKAIAQGMPVSSG